MSVTHAGWTAVSGASSTAVLEDFELPRLARLAPNLTAACFGLMKLRPARHIIESAERAGLLRDGMSVIETTSGAFGLALAMVCARKPYQLTVVTDTASDERLRRRMEQMGARVEVVTTPGGRFGTQGARLDRLRELLAENPASYWPNQYDNPLNPQSYASVADYLVRRLGTFDFLVGPVGTGGSMAGIALRLRELGIAVRIVAVDACKSVLFGQEDGARVLRGLGNSLLPKNLDHRLFDYVTWVPSADAFTACRALLSQYGLFMGPTSGAAFKVAQWWAACQPDARVVMIGPDDGNRYIDTLYYDNWYDRAISGFESCLEPLVVTHPQEQQEAWSLMHWARRSWEEVTGQPTEGMTYRWR